MIKKFSKIVLSALALNTIIIQPLFASAEESTNVSHGHFGIIFFMMAIMLIAGKIGNIIERFGQPGVIGELVAGIALSAAGYFGWDLIGDIAANEPLAFMASFGALLLLFSIGLESNIKEMGRVGVTALTIALIGVVVPFVTGAYILGPLLYGDEGSTSQLFLGAALVATSVGITATVFRSLGLLKTKVAQIILGAAIIDDVLGLIVLAVVSGIASGESFTASEIAQLVAKSFGFLGGAILIGSYTAKPISKLFSKIHTGTGMKIGIAVSFALLFGYLAELFGLEPIIGAFAAGLILDAVHFNGYTDPTVVSDLKALKFAKKEDREKVLGVMRKHRHSHVEDLIEVLNLVFVPIFFVYTGLQVEFSALLEPKLYAVALLIAVVAVIGKAVTGLADKKGDKREKLLVGMSMVPRGEVGLIFAATGKSLGVLSDELFAVIIIVVIMTTLIAPPMISKLAKPQS